MKKVVKKITSKARPKYDIWLVLLAGLAFRILLYDTGTLFLDQNTFIAWGRRLAAEGAVGFYRQWSDYLPGFLYVLGGIGVIEGFVDSSPTFLYKLPGMLGDIATGFVVYKIASKIKDHRYGLVATALYVFNPAVVANSTLWGQVDGLTALFALLSVYLFPISVVGSAIALSVGTLVKLQAAVSVIPILFVSWRDKVPPKKLFLFGLTGLSVFILAFIPFSDGNNLLAFVSERISVPLNQYPYGSVNAFNFWGLFGFWRDEAEATQKFAGYAIFLTLAALSSLKLQKVKNGEYLLLAILMVANFLFFTRMHERHLLSALAPLATLVGTSPIIAAPLFVLSMTYLLNLYYSYEWITRNFREVFSRPFINTVIFVNLLSLVALVTSTYRDSTKWAHNYVVSLLNSSTRDGLPVDFISRLQARRLLLVILGLSLVTRIFMLSTPGGEYFDEVYHAFTAQELLSGNTEAWGWWNDSPEGFAFEWTHPPFAKHMMVGGMSIFGPNEFGWRAPAALFGVASVFLVYAVSRELFGRYDISVFASAIFALDGLVLVMSRIGMNDIYFLTLALFSVWFFIKDKYALSALALGLSVSAKWSGLWTVPVLVAAFVLLKKRTSPGLLWFLVLPIGAYLLTYIPMLLAGHGGDTLWGLHKQMWWYHTGLVAEHGYASSFWTWPLLVRPVWLYTSGVRDQVVGNIYAMGNPIVFWFGLVSVAAAGVYGFLEKNRKLLFIVAAYVFFFVPWALSPRIMFLYHYLPSVPFLGIATGYILARFRAFIPFVFALALALFVYFYPHWTGIEVPVWLDRSYYWFPSWR